MRAGLGFSEWTAIDMRLEGKVIVITGAGAGMGRAMAKRFAAEGAKVVGGDVAADRLEAVAGEVRGAGGTMTALVGDVAKREDAEALVRAAIDTYGRLDALVNNAGVMDQFQGVATVDDGTWERLMAINLYGPMVTTRLAVQHMKAHGGGAIVNIASAAGVGGGSAGVAYTASKHGLVGLTRNTAFVYAPHGVRCNAVLAGGVATEIGSTIDPAKIDQEAMVQFGKWHAAMPAQLEADDIADLVLFLVSDEASCINGALVPADAGWLAA